MVTWVAAAVPWLVALGVKPPSTVAHAHAGTARADYARFEWWAIGLAIAFGGQFLAQCHPRFHIPLPIEPIPDRFGISTLLCMVEPLLVTVGLTASVVSPERSDARYGVTSACRG
jgi:hypothetical protein